MFFLLSHYQALAAPESEVQHADFPWIQELVKRSDQEIDEFLKNSWSRGCNASKPLIHRYKYQDFLDLTQDERLYEPQNVKLVKTKLIPALIRPQDRRNRHPSECMPAVIDALNLHRYFAMLTAMVHAMDDQLIWDICFQNIRSVHRVVDLLLGALSTTEVQDVVAAVKNSPPWSDRRWIEEVWADTSAEFDRSVASQADLGALVVSNSNIDSSDDTHLRLVRDSTRLLDALVREGLIQTWFIGRGTMIFAMRYGATRGILPSGHRDIPRIPPVDFDSYVLTDNWKLLRARLSEYTEAYNFTWCGFQQTWPQHALSCIRSDGELEINLAQASWAPSILPTTQCVLEAIESVGQRYLLPCPQSPRGFLTHIWDGEPANLTDCLPLPMSLNGTQANLAREDVEWLWGKALDLQKAGYANLAHLWETCEGHPWAELARELSTSSSSASFA